MIFLIVFIYLLFCCFIAAGVISYLSIRLWLTLFITFSTQEWMSLYASSSFVEYMTSMSVPLSFLSLCLSLLQLSLMRLFRRLRLTALLKSFLGTETRSLLYACPEPVAYMYLIAPTLPCFPVARSLSMSFLPHNLSRLGRVLGVLPFTSIL